MLQPWLGNCENPRASNRLDRRVGDSHFIVVIRPILNPAYFSWVIFGLIVFWRTISSVAPPWGNLLKTHYWWEREDKKSTTRRDLTPQPLLKRRVLYRCASTTAANIWPHCYCPRRSHFKARKKTFTLLALMFLKRGTSSFPNLEPPPPSFKTINKIK